MTTFTYICDKCGKKKQVIVNSSLPGNPVLRKAMLQRLICVNEDCDGWALIQEDE